MLRCVVLVLLVGLVRGTDFEQLKQLALRWAPLVWMSPEEQYFPSGVDHFLENVHLANEIGKTVMVAINETHFPQISTKNLYLVTNRSLDGLLRDKHSFLNGHNPKAHPVPMYAMISSCTLKFHFTVSYWVFYPYNRGKDICFIGKVPCVTLFGRCLGHRRTIGSHVGDWEHVTLFFKGNPYPSDLFIAIHDTGGYYKFDRNRRHFHLNPRKKTRGLQRAQLPPVIKIQGSHPVLFAALGSHGFWPAPGEHEFVKIPRLTDKCGYGVPWETWRNLKVFSLEEATPKWLFFKGRWGNAKSGCVLAKKLGLCEHTDGPVGVLRDNREFSC